MKYKVDNNYVS